MSDIVWEDPPRGQGREGRDWPKVLAPLRDRPGQWARIAGPANPGAAASTASNLKGHIKTIDPTEFEFKARTVDGEGFVYARFIGNGTTP